MTMNILKVGSSPYYHFRSTPYTTKVTDAVKLFGTLETQESRTGFKLGRKIEDTRYIPMMQ